MNARKISLICLVAVYVFLWFGGVVAHSFLGGPPAHVAWTAPLFLVVAGAIVLLTPESRKIGRLVGAGAVGTIAEIVGVHTGFPFGGYTYTTALFPHVFEVPLVMACAWTVLAAYAQQLVAPLKLPAVFAVPLFALVLTSIDLVIDPVAAGPLGYWVWQHPGVYYGIPASNFAGWLIVSACVGVVSGTQAKPVPLHRFVGYSIIGFFTSIAALNAMMGVAAIGLALLAVPLLPRGISKLRTQHAMKKEPAPSRTPRTIH